jgi:hypothetical protein
VRVIETIQFDEQLLENCPWLEHLGPGLIVTLDIKPQQPLSFLVEPGATVRVHRPDGTFIDRVVKGAEPEGPNLFFPNTEAHEIPISSEIELLP